MHGIENNNPVLFLNEENMNTPFPKYTVKDAIINFLYIRYKTSFKENPTVSEHEIENICPYNYQVLTGKFGNPATFSRKFRELRALQSPLTHPNPNIKEKIELIEIKKGGREKTWQICLLNTQSVNQETVVS